MVMPREPVTLLVDRDYFNANVVAGSTQITDTGLMAFADIAGTKYWKNKKLNK